MARSRHTSAANARREVEARTGTCANLKTFGFRPVKFALSGEPTRFVQDGTGYTLQRCQSASGQRQWRVEHQVGEGKTKSGVRFPRVKKIDSPRFAGPVAAAVWLQLEVSNGGPRYSES